uniref:Uncharacterized protein n=1 Tax=Sphaerodactylus townsendi TaxID=933632 RepID=A0ACB8FZC2_9SAUR
MAALDLEAARGSLGSLLRDFPRPLGPDDALPWSPLGRGGDLSQAEAPAEMGELARSFLGSRILSVNVLVDEARSMDEQRNVVEDEGRMRPLVLMEQGIHDACG